MADEAVCIYDRLWEANVRIEQMWPFPVGPAPRELRDAFEMAGDEGLPEAVKSLIENWDDGELDELFDGAHDAFEELMASAFRRDLKGWIGIAAVPVFEPTKRGHVSFSWGYYNTQMLFSPTADGLLTAAAEWGEGLYDKAHERAGWCERW
ncbi:hypothetical protein ACFSTI_20905 [Rhizorhabdus histidinilytica]|uniref:Uncharacterized protein n=1 Tax=Rhizorhabdus histidinilytica TaxID=439228 RepID=A0A1T5BMV1_9SPHN|nr:hypothetical protein [Rhizorhabdus histidinilytica]SKB48447.1 hypothetical protein SAMN06295920_103127 [Rhizorhabdus histidinilytica]